MTEEEISRFQQGLIETLKKSGALQTAQVEYAFRSVPRHLFLPDEPLERAYSDIAIATKRSAEGEWTSSSSQPAIMAIMLEQLDLHPGQRVLEIGAGTGFNAALIAAIVGPEGQVTTIDIQPDLIESAHRHLDMAGYPQVQAIAADGGYGYPPGAPYDRIILTVSSAVITPAWREQLAEGGRLVLPLSLGAMTGSQISIAFERRGAELVSNSQKDCGFMPLQGAFSTSNAQPVKTQIGPDPNLFMDSLQELPFTGETLAGWLEDVKASPASQSSEAYIPTQVRALTWEIWGFLTWLAIYQAHYAQLVAEGDLAGQNAIPPLLYYGRGQEGHTCINILLVEPSGAAALTRSPDQPVPFWDFNSGPVDQPETPFELYIRPLGPNPSAAKRLLEIVQEWDRAGKSASARLRFRAIPAEMDYQPVGSEIVLERPWTNFVVKYVGK